MRKENEIQTIKLMILNNYLLESILNNLNEHYLTEKRFATHKVVFTSDITRVSSTQSKIALYIEVTFTSKKDNVQLAKATFNKSFELDNNTPVNLIYEIVYEAVKGIKEFLEDKIPFQTIEITPPLIAHYEIKEQSDYFASELAKLS